MESEKKKDKNKETERARGGGRIGRNVNSKRKNKQNKTKIWGGKCSSEEKLGVFLNEREIGECSFPLCDFLVTLWDK